jgi:poly(hydroxyalkanoate) granule-associated protein
MMSDREEAMAEATTDMAGTTAPAAEATATLTHGLRRAWLAGLGLLAIAREQAQSAIATLEEKGQQLEPSVTAPFRRAGDAANRAAERAGESMRTVGSLGTRLGVGDWTERVERIVDDKVGAALQRLDLPTRQDLQALADRIEEVADKENRPGRPKA